MKTILHSDFILQKSVALFLTLVSSKAQYKRSSCARLFSWDRELSGTIREVTRGKLQFAPPYSMFLSA